MSSAVAPTDLLRPRAAEGWGLAMWMALAAHGLLLLCLMLGVRWHTATPEALSAEMWAQVPVAAAPAPVPVEPEPPPAVSKVEPPPQPLTEAPPPPVAALPKAAPPEAPPAQINVEVKPKKPEPKLQPEPEPPAKTPPQPKPEAKPEAKPAPKPAPQPVVKPAPPVAEKLPPATKVARAPVASAPTVASAQPRAAPAASREEMERARQDNLNRMIASLSGDALHSAGPSAEYAGRIKGRIKPNVVFTEAVNGNPLATVEVRCAPDGQIIGRKLLTSSGVPAWDDAVLRAIDRTEVLPLNDKGKIPPVMQIDFRPKDF